MYGMKELLGRYQGRCVSIQSHGYRRYIGLLALVTDEYVVLKNATAFDDYEGSRWQDEQAHWNVKEGVETGFAETAIALAAINAVTSSDTDGLPPLDELGSKSAKPVLSELQTPLIYPVPAIELGFGPELISFASKDLANAFEGLRRAFREDYCFELPKINLRCNLDLGPLEFNIVLHGWCHARGQIRPSHLCALGLKPGMEAISDLLFEDLATGLRGCWVEPADRQRAELAGMNCYAPLAHLLTTLGYVLRQNPAEIFTLENTVEILRTLSVRMPTACNEYFGTLSSRLNLHGVLQELLREGLKLQPIDRIIECVMQVEADTPQETVDSIRTRLIDYFLQSAINSEGEVSQIVLSQELIDELSQIIQSEEHQVRFCMAIAEFAKQIRLGHGQGVLVIPDSLRRTVARVLHGLRREVMVISTGEQVQSHLPRRIHLLSIDAYCGLANHNRAFQSRELNTGR